MSNAITLLANPDGTGWTAWYDDDFALYAARPLFDRSGHMLVDLCADIPDTPNLYATRLRITDMRDREAFAKKCDPKPVAQRLIERRIEEVSTALWYKLRETAMGVVAQAEPGTAPDRPRFDSISAQALHAKVLSPIQWVVHDILPAGGTLFTGRAKDGKSMLAWNLCISVSEGGKALGTYDVDTGDVLYLALEDGERRAQKRLREQMKHSSMTEAPRRLDLVLWDVPRLGEGFEDRAATWIEDHPEARLIVVDILEKVRQPRTRSGSVYSEDYTAIAPLSTLATRHNIAILILHHNNKSNATDFRDWASGSTGLTAACDTAWALNRLAGESNAALHITGRDVDEQEIAMQFKDGFWTALGDAQTYRMSEESKDVLEVLRQKPTSPSRLATELAIPSSVAKMRLSRMAKRGEIRALGDGTYIPTTEIVQNPVTPVTLATPVTPVTPVTLSNDAAMSLSLGKNGLQGVVTGNREVTGKNAPPVTSVLPSDSNELGGVSVPRVTGVTPFGSRAVAVNGHAPEDKDGHAPENVSPSSHTHDMEEFTL